MLGDCGVWVFFVVVLFCNYDFVVMVICIWVVLFDFVYVFILCGMGDNDFSVLFVEGWGKVFICFKVDLFGVKLVFYILGMIGWFKGVLYSYVML